MPHALLLSVRFHDGCYHGAGDWPPSPARLFQALLAGVGVGKALSERAGAALSWLETLEAPLIATPSVREGQALTTYVPNNDLDAVRGDRRRIGEIRAEKVFRPKVFNVSSNASVPLLYVWTFEGGENDDDCAQTVCAIAERLYQFGRGVDMAWAHGEVLTPEELDRRLASYPGPIHRPSAGGWGTSLACPQRGSLKSLLHRHTAARFEFGRKVLSFSKAPRPRFAQAVYDSPPHRYLFDVRGPAPEAPFAPWPATSAAALVEIVRDAAAAQLSRALPQKKALIERVLVGRGASEADKAGRPRIIPLPSIGHPHAEFSIRRILLEIPPNCPLQHADIEWAVAGLHLGTDYETVVIREESAASLVSAENWSMAHHYGIGRGREGRLWHTATPAVLPETAARRHIDPASIREKAKGARGARERLAEEARAIDAVHQALRHAGIDTPVEAIRVQREPLAVKGARADAFAPGTRFSKRRLWHVEVTFTEPRSGPVVIGDGRYLGLGLMAPVRNALRDHVVFPLSPELPVAAVDAPALLHAVRRALMALSRDGEGKVPRLFSGHEADGAPVRSNKHEHIFLAVDDTNNDGLIDRLIVAAPWTCDRKTEADDPKRALFDHVVCKLQHVRAVRLGIIALGRPSALLNGDPLVGPAQAWESRTPYRPTRHASRGKGPATAVMQDAITECARRGLPRPEIEVLKLDAGPNGGNLAARLRLRFAATLEGPILLGCDSHMGGGLFAATDEDGHAGR